MTSARRDLTAMLRPRSIALVGATDRSRWSQNTFDNLINRKYAGEIHLVSRRGGTVHGRTRRHVLCRRRRADRPRPADGADGRQSRKPWPISPPPMCDNAVILTSGFAETGHDGAEHQARLGIVGSPAQRIAARPELPRLRQLHRQCAAVDRRLPRAQPSRRDRRRDAERRQRQLHLQPRRAARNRPVAYDLDRQRSRPRLRRTSSTIWSISPRCAPSRCSPRRSATRRASPPPPGGPSRRQSRSSC